jgi:hypothetical protein
MNAVIKIFCRSPIFKDQYVSSYAVKVKKGVEAKVPSSFNSLSPSLQRALFNWVSQVSPTNGPWEQVTQLLCHCEEAFDESAAAVKQAGMPANQIACVSHMLVDVRVILLLVKAKEMFPTSKRPAGLDHQKATGSSRSSTLYAEAYKQYRTWQKEYINPFTEGQFAENLKGMKPHLAQIKDGDDTRKLVVHVVRSEDN